MLFGGFDAASLELRADQSGRRVISGRFPYDMGNTERRRQDQPTAQRTLCAGHVSVLIRARQAVINSFTFRAQLRQGRAAVERQGSIKPEGVGRICGSADRIIAQGSIRQAARPPCAASTSRRRLLSAALAIGTPGAPAK